jgi:hypothetical protein
METRMIGLIEILNTHQYYYYRMVDNMFLMLGQHNYLYYLVNILYSSADFTE